MICFMGDPPPVVKAEEDIRHDRDRPRRPQGRHLRAGRQGRGHPAGIHHQHAPQLRPADPAIPQGPDGDGCYSKPYQVEARSTALGSPPNPRPGAFPLPFPRGAGGILLPLPELQTPPRFVLK